MEESDGESEEIEDEGKTESEEEEDLKKLDGAVFEKCFASADDRVWSAVTTSWRVNIGRLNLEDSKLTEKMGLDPDIGSRKEVLLLIKNKMAEVVIENNRNQDEEEDGLDHDGDVSF